jgi:hypothetical protein
MPSLGNFNADDFQNEYTPIPVGRYNAVITASEMKPTKSGGQRLALTVEIIEGQYMGRKIFTGINLVNANPEAEKIAKIELSNVCRAVGIIHPRESEELHNKPLSIKVAIKPETEQYPAGNEIKGWDAIAPDAGREKTINVSKAPPAQEVAPAPAGNKKPWEK